MALTRVTYFCLCLLLTTVCYILALQQTQAQISTNDWQLIEKQTFHKSEYDKRQVKFFFIGKNPVVRYNPISLTLGSFMYCYQKFISPQFSSNCGYEISCSNFSKRVIQEYGIIKGMALTADRLTRCTPFAGIDFNQIFLNSNNKIIDNPEKYKGAE